MGVLEEQFTSLLQDYPSAQMKPQADGTFVVVIEGSKLAQGWNQATTTVRFVVPLGYPIARPDCFWTDSNVRVANGTANPKNAAIQLTAFAGEQMWFSWHVGSWNPQTDSLKTYMKVIEARLKVAE